MGVRERSSIDSDGPRNCWTLLSRTQMDLFCFSRICLLFPFNLTFWFSRRFFLSLCEILQFAKFARVRGDSGCEERAGEAMKR